MLLFYQIALSIFVCVQLVTTYGANAHARFSNVDMCMSLFQSDLLKTHDLHVKEALADALQREYILSLRDERSPVRIHCTDLAMKLPGI
jgi:hypothetical protein